MIGFVIGFSFLNWENTCAWVTLGDRQTVHNAFPDRTFSGGER